MLENAPRSLLAVAAIVALLCGSLAVRDYFQQRKQATPPPITTAAIDPLNGSSAPGKTVSKRKAARISLPKGKSRAAETSAEDADNRLAPTLATSSVVLASMSATSKLQSAGDAQGEPIDGRNQLPNQWRAMPARPIQTSLHCLPLPNLTDSRDVDASYYRNWAREYSCRI